MEKNAKIESTMLGFEDHGIMTAMLHLDLGGSGIGFGGYCLGGMATDFFIKEVMAAIGVEKWEDLKGKYCRIKFDGANEWGSKAIAIGHITKDTWFNAKEWSESMKS